MDPTEARDLFPVCDEHIHMNHAGVSPLSARVRAAVDQALEAWSSHGFNPDAYLETLERLRSRLAELVAVTPDQVAITRGTAHGISLLARGLPWEAGDNVVGARLEYPANLFPWQSLKDRGVEMRLVEPVGGRVTPDAVLSLVDGRTRVVALSWIQFWNGYRIDIAKIGAECRRRGVILAVDGIQGLGAFPFDLDAMNADFVAAGSGKWLMGVPGIGFTAWRQELLERIDPLLVGTNSMVDKFEYFAPEFEYSPTGRKFEESAISWLDVAAFEAAVELLQEVGIEVVGERILNLSERLARGLEGRGFEIVEPWPRERSESSGIVSFRKPGSPAAEQLRDLTAAGVITRTHRDFVRLSPHFYNTDSEVDRVLDVLAPEAAVL
ncbi:MAG: aminotransferase class V-fold PLP-dependent enzyme [Candidatus Dormibacteraceae bacterium]